MSSATAVIIIFRGCQERCYDLCSKVPWQIAEADGFLLITVNAPSSEAGPTSLALHQRSSEQFIERNA